MKKYAIIGLLILTGCSSDTPVPERFEPPDSNAEAKELSDATIRATTPERTLKYEDTGVIFGSDADGMVYAIDITDGHNVKMNVGTQTLVIDGKIEPVEEIKLAKTSGSVRWYAAYTKSGASVYLVTQY